jgi:hypothetical protein
VIRGGAEHGAPAGDFVRRHVHQIAADALGERRADLAFRVDEPDQDVVAERVDLMGGIGSHQHRSTFGPRLARPATHPQPPVQRHHQLDAVVPVRRRSKSWPPYDHCGRPDHHARSRVKEHQPAVWHRGRARASVWPHKAGMAR